MVVKGLIKKRYPQGYPQGVDGDRYPVDKSSDIHRVYNAVFSD
ncbi:hypothetical protein [Caudoviricetes sp.]|nr:hypothetical protein [Caudoviricetes sp.]